MCKHEEEAEIAHGLSIEFHAMSVSVYRLAENFKVALTTNEHLALLDLGVACDNLSIMLHERSKKE